MEAGLCDVGVHFAVFLRAGEVLSLDESFDSFLDGGRVGQEARLQLLRDLKP